MNKILEKIDWNKLNYYITNKLILSNKHPEYDLWILNYTAKVQASGLWDDYTLACRGLVIDTDGNILARPFKKFKNLEEYKKDEIDLSKKYEVFEKIDGSLIILFYYQPRMEWIFASRGSFISEQANVAKTLFNQNAFDILDTKYTYLFEIVYPENRIVVNYGDKKDLILLTKINTLTGDEPSYEEIVKKYSKYFSIVKKFNFNIKSLYDLKSLEENNKEGFVVKFEDNFRVKIKFNEYVRLHGILTNVSNITIWELMMKGYDFNVLLDKIPDEFYQWLKKVVNDLQLKFNEIERVVLKEFVRIYHINNITNRKDFATEALKSEHYDILFKIYDKRPYDELIWKKIKPVHSKPFRDNYEYGV